MILTYKLRHNRNFNSELNKARQVAEYAIRNRNQLSSKYYSHLGLPSYISSQIAWRYGRNKKAKRITNVNLLVPSNAIKIQDKTLKVKCLALELDISYLPEFISVRQVEITKEFAHISVEVNTPEPYTPDSFSGLDRNTTGHIAVLSIDDGRVFKYTKSARFIRRKYKEIRRKLQRKKLLRNIKHIAKKEFRVLRDLNHKISRNIVDLCKENKSALILEDLTGIRRKTKYKSWNGDLNSWSFYQLEQFISYKAVLAGVPVYAVPAAYTSQMCSRCGEIGHRNKKSFVCPYCGHVDNADANAGFNIAWRGAYLLNEHSASFKSNTGVARWAPVKETDPTQDLSTLSGTPRL
jgi:putative transposase